MSEEQSRLDQRVLKEPQPAHKLNRRRVRCLHRREHAPRSKDVMRKEQQAPKRREPPESARPSRVCVDPRAVEHIGKDLDPPHAPGVLESYEPFHDRHRVRSQHDTASSSKLVRRAR
eukprot:Amastigsp_a842161_15.p5 type:complete len:117 gc:universal Amastigsp_a842161_15:778-428(-)